MSSGDVTRIEYVVAGLVVLIVFAVASRFIAHFIASQLHRHNVRTDMVVLGRRVAYVVVIGIGILGAIGLATQTANVTLVGILLATVVAALGVQQLLQDYVSGYYVLLERHIRIGDRIAFDETTGTVSEIRLRVTLLRTDEGHLAVIPNSELFTKPVTIFTKVVEQPPPPPPPEAPAKPAPPA